MTAPFCNPITAPSTASSSISLAFRPPPPYQPDPKLITYRESGPTRPPNPGICRRCRQTIGYNDDPHVCPPSRRRFGKGRPCLLAGLTLIGFAVGLVAAAVLR